jgi:uncharacterized protein (TIGR02145 family)
LSFYEFLVLKDQIIIVELKFKKEYFEASVNERYLKDFGSNKDGTRTGSRIGKAIASTMNWAQYQTGETIGSNSSNNNSTGFSALPGGHRYLNGDLFDLKEIGFYWSSTENGHT